METFIAFGGTDVVSRIAKEAYKYAKGPRTIDICDVKANKEDKSITLVLGSKHTFRENLAFKMKIDNYSNQELK